MQLFKTNNIYLKTILWIIQYLLYWLLFFAFTRIFFIIYHIYSFQDVSTNEILKTFIYGIRLDLSMAGYFSIAAILHFWIKNQKLQKKVIFYYSVLLQSIVILLSIIDVELFSFWGFRMDATPIKYLNTPKEMIASTMSSPWIVLTTLLIVFIILNYIVLKWYLTKINIKQTHAFYSIPQFVLYYLFIAICSTSMVLPIRGGFQLIPINESTVFYSNKPIANQAAINLPWTFIHSILEWAYMPDGNPYQWTGNKEAQKMSQAYFKTEKNDSIQTSLLKTDKPNIVLILWESFTAKIDSSHITPQFNQLKKEGIYFNNLYASGDRSDKGLVSVFSGYPAQPTVSIILYPQKSARLPFLPKKLKTNNYHTSFIYGGELEFANMNAYLSMAGFDQIIGKNEFPKEKMNSKWGAHDEETFNRLLQETNQLNQPFFSSLFTLSSHEPFEVPIKPHFELNNKDNLFKNAHYYTDSCLGDFIQKAKKTNWWKNTIVIIIADHGHVLPGKLYPQHTPDEFKIPMLWLGGALNYKDTTITNVASQTDFAHTLLAQLNIPSKDFEFSKNILKTKQEGAYYTFNEGLGWITPQSTTVYEIPSQKITFQQNTANLDSAKSILQCHYQDYLEK